MAEDFIGSGWAFPLSTGATGGIALVSGDREIEEAIRMILSTSPGERPMRPEFGCPIHDYLFSPSDAATAGRIAWDVRASLLRWEPRIEVQDVRVTVDDAHPTILYVEVTYFKRGTNDPRNLVFPFYTIGEEP